MRVGLFTVVKTGFVLPIYLSPKTFKRQSKILSKEWPRGVLNHTTARNILAKMYGFKDAHAYQNSQEDRVSSEKMTEEKALRLYPSWMKKLSDLGGINEIQASNVLLELWPGYFRENDLLLEKTYSCEIVFLGDWDLLIDEKKTTFTFNDKPSVKDSIQALGLPHIEVAAIEVNDQLVDFNYLLKDADRVRVYPYPHQSPIRSLTPKGGPRFLADVHLGGLRRYLNFAGIDCLYFSKDIGDAALAKLANKESRILLSRDVGLLKRSEVPFGRWIRSTDSVEQLKEVVQHYSLKRHVQPFSRCAKCNGELEERSKHEIEDELPSSVFEQYDAFKQCNSCKQVYWKGSHYDRILEILDQANLS